MNNNSEARVLGHVYIDTDGSRTAHQWTLDSCTGQRRWYEMDVDLSGTDEDLIERYWPGCEVVHSQSHYGRCISALSVDLRLT